MADPRLVTFALFTYNQAAYVPAAVRAALALRYRPLEIILSDDGSTDGTPEVLRELVAAYRGDLAPVLLLGSRNRGVIDHVLSVARRARGELLVVAAGDDVSHPDRVCRLARRWEETGAAALYSAASVIADDGRPLHAHARPEPLPRIQALFEGCPTPRRYGGVVRHVPGYSAAYATALLAGLPPCGTGAHNEDALTTYVLNLRGEAIEFVDEPLVARRLSQTSLSVRSGERGLAGIRRNERTARAFRRSSARFAPYVLGLVAAMEAPCAHVVHGRLARAFAPEMRRVRYDGRGLGGRLRQLLSRDRDIPYMLPRLFGAEAFVLAKWLVGAALTRAAPKRRAPVL